MMRRAAPVALAVLWALGGCNPQPGKTVATPSPSARPRSSATPLTLVVTGKGTKERPIHVLQQVHNRIDYDLLASSYESRGPQNDMRSIFRNARVTFSDPRGSKITASAPEAEVDQTTDAVTLSGGVVAHTTAGMTLHCDRLVYRQAGATLHGDGNVIITDPRGFWATGSSFDSDTSLTHMRMR
ncbi:MAG: LPS export ABC transporter periplasmic protein LptC [Candidatus Cybelea sp.]|jgi:lipopolysaccharide assembly outer membrane protein LptD (OstA)